MKSLLLCLLMVGCGATQLTKQDTTELGTYAEQLAACDTQPGAAAIDACKTQVRAHWCPIWAARFDAGVCQ